MRDQEVIDAADEAGLAMVFTRDAPLPALIGPPIRPTFRPYPKGQAISLHR